MALTVAQLEEISALLREVPRLVDQLHVRRPGFAEAVLDWLKRVETTLENNRLAVVSQIASCRAMLIEASRGVHDKNLVFVGRPSARKIVDATASMVIGRCNELLHGVIGDRQTVFQDAERIARQIMVVAVAKGFVLECGGRGHREFLQCLDQKIAADPDLVSAHAHLLALVGKSDFLVFLDRGLAKIA